MILVSDIVKWSGGVVGFLSFLLAARSLLVKLERERRALAVKLIYEWARDTDWATVRSTQIALALNEDVIKAINEKREASIPTEHYDSILSILATHFGKEGLPPPGGESSGTFQITSEQSAFIRFLWARWLNRLEGTLAAWQQRAADRELMEAEFKPLAKAYSGELKQLSVVREDLPVIELFYRSMNEDRKFKIRGALGIFSW